MRKSKRKGTLRSSFVSTALAARFALAVAGLFSSFACGPHAHIPTRPTTVGAGVDSTDPAALLVRRLAPVLYLQRDEAFPLSRVVAVVHPDRPVVAYHLLWRDDVNGAWIPFTKPTDEEIVWVGYDSTGAPTDVWTYWHGRTLHTDWRGKGTVAIDVQWGKHGSLPHGATLSDLPRPQRLAYFWLSTWVGLPDIWLGNISRKGPWCFCHGYRRYRDFSRTILVGSRLDAIVRAKDADEALGAVFGRPYSKKHQWPF
jgi:hypothetical protein